MTQSLPPRTRRRRQRRSLKLRMTNLRQWPSSAISSPRTFPARLALRDGAACRRRRGRSGAPTVQQSALAVHVEHRGGPPSFLEGGLQDLVAAVELVGDVLQAPQTLLQNNLQDLKPRASSAAGTQAGQKLFVEPGRRTWPWKSGSRVEAVDQRPHRALGAQCTSNHELAASTASSTSGSSCLDPVAFLAEAGDRCVLPVAG